MIDGSQLSYIFCTYRHGDIAGSDSRGRSILHFVLLTNMPSGIYRSLFKRSTVGQHGWGERIQHL